MWYCDQILLSRCVHSLGDLLSVLVTLDALIVDNDKLETCWNYYLRMMDLVRKDTSRYGTTDAKVEEMDQMLLHLKEVCPQPLQQSLSFSACLT